MPAYWKHLIIKSLLVGLVWQTHCVPTLPHGKIICISDQSGRTGAKVVDTLYPMTPLTTNEVKAKAIETYSESDLRQFLEGKPDFYNFKSSIFTDLDQGNVMKDDYIFMKNKLQNIKAEFHSTSEYMSKEYFNQVSKTIEQLEAFQKLIQKGIQRRIYEMKHQGSQIKEIGIFGIGEDGPLKKKAKIASPSSESFLLRKLGLDLVEEIHHRVWDGEVDKLSGILHGIPLYRDDNLPIIRMENERSLELQDVLFKQVGYIYKQKIISGDAFKKFFQSKITLEIAAFNMMYTCLKICGHYSPLTALNEWPSEKYRNIYEVLDEKNKRYFLYVSLKAYKFENNRIGDVDLEHLFKGDELFHTLENLVSNPSRNLQDLRNEDPNYEHIKNTVQELISMFQDNDFNPSKDPIRSSSFYVLEFIQNNYGLDILEVEKGEKLEEKMSVMSSSWKLFMELRNIHSYVEDRKIATKENKSGEEILIMHKLSKYLLLMHESLLIDFEMTNYVRLLPLIGLATLLDKAITKIIDEHQYYLHFNS